MGDGLSGHVALVTGGVRGIGLAICRAGWCRGASGGRLLAERGGGAAAPAGARPLGAHGPPGQHRGRDDCERVVGEVIDGTASSTSSSTTPASPMDRTYGRWLQRSGTTSWGSTSTAPSTCRARCSPHMLERGYGRIVNISSVIGETRQHRPGQLRGVEGRPLRAHEEPGARDRQQGDHRQLRRAGLHPDRHGRGRPRGRAR